MRNCCVPTDVAACDHLITVPRAARSRRTSGIWSSESTRGYAVSRHGVLSRHRREPARESGRRESARRCLPCLAPNRRVLLAAVASQQCSDALRGLRSSVGLDAEPCEFAVHLRNARRRTRRSCRSDGIRGRRSVRRSPLARSGSAGREARPRSGRCRPSGSAARSRRTHRCACATP